MDLAAWAGQRGVATAPAIVLHEKEAAKLHSQGVLLGMPMIVDADELPPPEDHDERKQQAGQSIATQSDDAALTERLSRIARELGQPPPIVSR